MAASPQHISTQKCTTDALPKLGGTSAEAERFVKVVCITVQLRVTVFRLILRTCCTGIQKTCF